MGGIVGGLQNTVDGVAKDIGITLTTITNIINSLQHDTSGTLASVANECTENLRIITRQAEYSSTLLTNGFLAMMTTMALSILLYLTQFSAFLRVIIWTIYASLCLHMMMTYIRHSRSQMLPSSEQTRASIQYQHQQLESTIAQSKSPTQIDLTGCRLSDKHMETVITQAINNRQCTSLKLICNQITPNGASMLAGALLNNDKLEVLSLYQNQVGDTGSQSFSTALSVNKSALKKLDLSKNEITDNGARYLAQMLKTNKVLTHLSLSHNRTGDRGVQILADSLQTHNNILEVLSLTKNKLLTDAGVDALATLLKHNQSLRELWINDCNLSKRGKDRLRKAARPGFKLHM